MPNQNNTQKPQVQPLPKVYDIGDMHDLASLAESDMNWVATAIGHIRKELRKIHKLSKDGERIYQHHFEELITHIDMYEYLIDSRLKYHTKEAEAYKAEYETADNKKEVTL